MPPTCTIRSLTAQDEPFLWEMLYQAIYVPAGQPLPDRAILAEPSIARYVTGWSRRPGDLGFAALEPLGQQPVGAAWLRLFTRLEPGYGFVAGDIPELSAAVLPDYRGQGLGTRLIGALLHAAAGSCKAVSLSVSSANPAFRLYRKLGFEVVSEQDASLTMLKTLSPGRQPK